MIAPAGTCPALPRPIPARRRAREAARFVLAGVGVAALVAVLALPARLSPHDPAAQAIGARLLPPLARTRGEAFILGTDDLGRDVLSRLIFGARTSLGIGCGAVLTAAVLGVTAGLASGYAGGWLDLIVMRLVDVQMAFPFILLAILAVAVLGPSPRTLIIVLAVGGWVHFARVIRSEILGLREREFVDAARAVGVSPLGIAFRHLLPSVGPTVIALSAVTLAYVIIAESSLSFLGVGVPPSLPSWGAMLADGRQYVDTAWWLATFPGLAILVTALGCNLAGDWLRDRMDPVRWRRRG